MAMGRNNSQVALYLLLLSVVSVCFLVVTNVRECSHMKLQYIFNASEAASRPGEDLSRTRQPTNSSSSLGNSSKSSIRLVVGVLSVAGNVEARRAIRETWGSDARLARMMFFVLRPKNDTAFKQLRQEAVATGDMVITSDICNHYHNITYAVMDIFRSAAVLQDSITHVVKTDDDAYVRWSLLLPALEAMPRQWLYAGAPMENGSVLRRAGWHQVSYENWARDDPVLYSYGLGYVVSIDVAQHIAAAAPHVIMPGNNLLIIEDMAMGYWVDFIAKLNNVTINYRTIEHSLGKCTPSAMFWHITVANASVNQPLGKPGVIRCMFARQGACCS